MYHSSVMHAEFEAEKNRKAFTYTVIICIIILLLALFIRWTIQQPPTPIIPDLIEVNLGNNNEGFGKVQPLIKGEMNNSPEPVQQQQVKASAAHDEPSRDIQPDENEDKDAAPVTKPVKPNPQATNIAKEPVTKPVKNNNPTASVQPTPKQQKPLIAPYKGPGNGVGNGANQDNGFREQGNNPNGHGDIGSENGTTGGLRVIKGDRKIMRSYSFTDNLDRATINAIIRVSEDGKGTFAGFDKGSSRTDRAYAASIAEHLSQIQFNTSDHESTVTVQFNFHF
jgi:hypothetical protein